MLISDRVRMIMKSQNLNASEFADRIDVKRSNLSHILSGRNKPSLDFLMKLLQVYPKVNAGWLILGENNEGVYKGNEKEYIIPKKNQQITVEDNYEAPVLSKVTQGKTDIDRVLIFFKDGTFKNYSPE